MSQNYKNCPGCGCIMLFDKSYQDVWHNLRVAFYCVTCNIVHTFKSEYEHHEEDEEDELF